MTIPYALLFSTFHLFTFYFYNRNYALLRKNDRYAQEKPPISSMPLARKITKVAFAISTFFVLLSFWSSGFLLFWLAPLAVRGIGLCLSFLAFLFIRKALIQLGENYSPIFDTHKPKFIVRQGLYRYIRHPVYLGNMLMILGYVLSSGSLIVLYSSLWGWSYMIYSIIREDQYLAQNFADYRDYQKKSWRVIPFIF